MLKPENSAMDKAILPIHLKNASLGKQILLARPVTCLAQDWGERCKLPFMSAWPSYAGWF